MAARPKELVCGRSPAGNVGLNPAGGIDFFFCKCCVLSVRVLCAGLVTRTE